MKDNKIKYMLSWIAGFIVMVALLSTWAILRFHGKSTYVVIVWFGAIFAVLFYAREYNKKT